MTKQTAVEWLKKELEDYGSNSHLSLDWNTFDELCEQAKQMEKEQTLEFTRNAVRKILDEDRANPFNLEQYYNEIYGK
jgi:urocanate hydratase